MSDERYCTCPACRGTGAGQGDNTYCGYCGGDGSVPEHAVAEFRKRHPNWARPGAAVNVAELNDE